MQECDNSEQLHENKEGANEESHLTEKENLEHPTSSTTNSDSSVAVKVLEANSCGLVACLQQGAFDVSQKPFAESKDNLEGPVKIEEKELGGDHPPSSLNKTTGHDTPGFDNLRETNMQDGSVQIIKDHVTHCPFSFQNSLLYDLD